ncbi:hypothetical protein D3Z51_12780 [Clostridiaceae bacterium]|nr:hypothetical protein [Clostridiaceae bacterium]RKI12196.1 hypothetical protein D7V81_12255 [bacterium 1XD21-70]
MQRQKVAVVTLGDSRREFYRKREHIALAEVEKVKEAFGGKYELFMPQVVFDAEEGQAVADEIRRRGIEAVILHVPIWATPSLAFRIAYGTRYPVLLLGNLQRDTSSLVTLLAVAGMLDQTGKTCFRVSGDYQDPEIQKKVDVFVKGIYVAEGVRRSSFGMVGGRSIGIGTTVADPSQWQSQFGIEFDHCDQYEIVYRAGELDGERVERHLKWVKEQVPDIRYGGGFTEDALRRQVQSYLALKDMAAEKKYDFIGVKCQQDMSDHFVLQCLGVALLNNCFDADGVKDPIPTSCECDCDGALTMRILSLCAQGAPSCLLDIKFFDGDSKEFVLANCGSVAPYFADPDDPEGCMKKIALMPHIFGEAGGSAIQMIAKPGKVTVARLYRSKGKYVLGCFEGTTKMYPLEKLKETTYCYPHAFVEAEADYNGFYQKINSNHLHMVYGSYAKVLEQFCRIVGIEYICFNQ